MKPFSLLPLYRLASDAFPSVIGLSVSHQGESIGTIKDVRCNMPNGRAYALVQPHELLHDMRRLPLDELVEVQL